VWTTLWLPWLVVACLAASDERRHRPTTEPFWAESWTLDFAARDGSLGGYVRLALYPNLAVAWYWAALVGTGRRLVMVRDHELEVPRGRELEIRGQGIWSTVTCETPLEHWSVGLEAFALALDDPFDAFGRERGDQIALGYDLEWEATAPASAFPPAPGEAAAEDQGYWQGCRVSGEILVGDEKLDFDGTGCRDHRWGIQDWWVAPLVGGSGVAADGTAFAVAGDAIPSHAVMLAPAPLLLAAPDGREARLMRALMAYRSGAGHDGYGWAQWIDAA
jgi:hypothetical protein